MSLTAALIRFVAGGLVVASVPIVSRRVSPSVAGVLVLIPIVTLLSLLFIGRDQGISAVADASKAAIFALPTVVGFLAGVYFASQRSENLGLVLLAGSLAWVVIAVPASLVLHR